METRRLKRSLAIETPRLIGKEVLLKGWVKTRRDHGKLIFFDLRDRSGLVQTVVDQKNKGAYKIANELRPEYAIGVTGVVNKRPAGTVNKALPTGEVEVEVEKLTILAKAQPLPFDMGAEELRLELPTLLDHRSLTLRHPKVKAIFEIQEVIINTFRQTLKNLGFAEFQAPIIVPATAEGGAEVFPIKYFDYTAYLGQSPQLYKQILLGVFERVFTVTHAFRAEPSVTTRHLTEYISLDTEMAFIDSWQELMDTVEFLIREILKTVEKQCSRQLAIYKAVIPLISTKIPRFKLREAQEIIYKRTKRDNRKEPDLQPADEEEICQWAKEEMSSDLVFITHYPVKKRPFYTYPDPDDPDYTLGFDLLGRGVEWATGGQRINEYEKLVENVKKWGNNPRDFELYLQAFKYGLPPEGGFALGAERITMKILGLQNIREASLFPRDMERIDGRLSNS